MSPPRGCHQTVLSISPRPGRGMSDTLQLHPRSLPSILHPALRGSDGWVLCTLGQTFSLLKPATINIFILFQTTANFAWSKNNRIWNFYSRRFKHAIIFNWHQQIHLKIFILIFINTFFRWIMFFSQWGAVCIMSGWWIGVGAWQCDTLWSAWYTTVTNASGVWR